MTLLELAAACEAAEGPDRELDHAVWRVADPVNAAHAEANGNKPLPWLHQYTSSLDWAMSLVPEGWLLATLNERNASGEHNWRWKAELWDCNATRRLGEDAPHVRGIARNAHAATPALALTSAALKARARASQEAEA
jgi:hypothetical protein